jgi:nickel transport protein
MRVAVVCVCLACLPAALPAAENSPQEIVTLLKEQHHKLAGELRRIQREIAALRAELETPGTRDVFAGIGYIFGLFGVAAFVASRRKG